MIPSPEEVEARLRRASALSDLRADRRLDAKIDLSPDAIEARLREASSLLTTCLELARFSRREDGD
ncbi:MAG: hypothetical protein KIT84_23890 [Labilithrix sp.]|nr:hypothetical protein [Labilithrix sp.]MCW5814091.1 hypothetical protein [Labilithrix sp.]